MRDGLIDQQNRDGLPPHPGNEPAARSPIDWLGLPMELYILPAKGESLCTYLPHAMVAVARSGRGRRWATSGTHRRQLYTAPRMVEMYDAGTAFDRFEVDGESGEIIGLGLPEATTARWLQDDARPLRVGLRQELFDDQLANLLLMLWDEACTGGRQGRLYTEGLTTALLGLLDARYRRERRPALPTVSHFGPAQRERLLSFIAAELCNGLCVDRLAAVVAMSPFHFSRVFKASFRQSPHAFVVAKRLDAACAALRREPERSVTDIAHGCGFASQAHFTAAFRRRMGTPPAQWRRMG